MVNRVGVVLATLVLLAGCQSARRASHAPTPENYAGHPRYFTRLRVLDEQGPVAHARVAIEVDGRDVDQLIRGTTDQAGEARTDGQPASGEVHVVVWRGNATQPRLEAVVTLAPRDEIQQVLDLGDVRVNPTSLFVGGVVRDTNGKPLSGAHVAVRHWIKPICALSTTIEEAGTQGDSFVSLGASIGLR